MKKLLFLLLLVPHFLFSFDDNKDPTIVENVNIITGALQLSRTDSILKGPIPFPITRTYSSRKLDSFLRNLLSKTNLYNFEDRWNLLPHLYLRVQPQIYYSQIAYVKEPSGSVITYISEQDCAKVLRPVISSSQNSGFISGRQNVCNNYIKLSVRTGQAKLHLANGGIRYYKGTKDPTYHIRKKGKLPIFDRYLRLEKERLPSGHYICYKYKKNKITIKIKNPKETKVLGVITFKNKKDHIKIETSDQRTIKIFEDLHKKTRFLSSVENPCLPTEKYIYTKVSNGFMCKGFTRALTQITHARRPYLYVDYYNSYRVKSISNANNQVAFFAYGNGRTSVWNADKILTKYFHTDNKINLIHYYNEANELFSFQTFIWDEDLLVAKEMCDAYGNVLFKKSFVYDSYKNVISETLTGDQSYTKHYTYNDQHLLIEENEESGLTYSYEYLNNTDLLTRKTTHCNGVILEEDLYTYDEDHLLIEERTHNDYKKYIRDPHSGFIQELITPLKKITYDYDDNNQITTENIFDANGEYRYSIKTTYDSAGNITSKTTPLGLKNTYCYDKWNNPTIIKEVGSPRKEILYNALNQPVLIDADQLTYDKKGNLLSRRSHKGVTTQYTYDNFNHCVKKTHPFTTYYEYDILGNVVCQVNANNSLTTTSYNILKKPTSITYPNGTTIYHTYSNDGLLKETTTVDGSITYEYDPLQRLIKKTHGKFSESWEYDGPHLKSYTDFTGLKTTYFYDDYGRKIKEKTLDREIEFSYDPLNFLEITKQGDVYTQQIHDVEGNIIEENENDYNKIRYLYDNEGRRCKAIKITSQGTATDHFTYDHEGKIISHRDPNDNETLFIYTPFKKRIIDPLGNITIESFNASDLLIKTEKQNPKGETTSLEELFYDNIGKLKKQLTTIYQDNTPSKTIELAFNYDRMGNLIEEIEENKKITTHLYDQKGRLIETTFPNKITLYKNYDTLDRITELKSSDNSIHYLYHYTPFLSEIEDLINKTSLHRNYNPFGEVTSQTTTHKTSWTYDQNGRVKTLTLPDQSQIQYTYFENTLRKVSRLSPSGKELYSHNYTKFDPNKHVEEEQMIYNLGKIISTRNLLERPTQMTSPYHTYTLSYGSSGLITHSKNTLTEEKNYSYDSLNQLVQEGEKSYHFDSLNNPTDCTVNNFNQITQTSGKTLTYDLNGNLITNGTTRYTYDALNRLTSIKTPEQTTTYTYDPLSHLQKEHIETSNNQEKTHHYLYNGEFEIGKLDENQNITQLKVLGMGIKGDIGAAVAIEIDNQTYAPLHDLQGTIYALIDRDKNLVESYNFNAFGEESENSHINPWRFSSKRFSNGLIYFGKRFYDPLLKRFITKDPLGFKDGRNAYAYVQNSPLNRLDLFGLISFSITLTPDKPAQFLISPDTKYQSNPIVHTSSYIPKTILTNTKLAGVTVEMIFICDTDYTLNFTPKEIEQGNADLIDHLDEFLPAKGSEAGLFYYGNGINTSRKDWIDNCYAYKDKLPKGSAIISIFNPSWGLIPDILRTMTEKNGAKSPGVRVLTSFLSDTLSEMEKINPDAKLVINPHSECGAMLHSAIQRFCPEHKLLSQKNLMVGAMGPASAIPKDFARLAINYYSKQDFITGGFAIPYIYNKNYEIKWLKAISPLPERTMYIADHNFVGPTYQTALEKFIEKISEQVGIHVKESR